MIATPSDGLTQPSDYVAVEVLLPQDFYSNFSVDVENILMFLLLEIFPMGVSQQQIFEKIADSLLFHVSPNKHSELKNCAQSGAPYPFCSYLNLIRNCISTDVGKFCSLGTQVRKMTIVCYTVDTRAV